MKNDAIAIANYFVDKANEEDFKLTLLRLVKYVYIAYGFALALLNRIIIDKRFDVVEAWKYGPVIPSVYHSFKHNQNAPMTQKVSVLINEDESGNMTFFAPTIEDEEIKQVLDFVWEKYKNRTTGDLINILHSKGTPWHYCYKEGCNVEIPDEMTKFYYRSIVANALRNDTE